MAFSACCGTGVLTDVVTGLPRGLVTMFFFMMGVFLGFPFQMTASWVRKSWLTTKTGAQLAGGVYFPDLFHWDGLEGYLGAIALTAILAGTIAYISKKYEEKHRAMGTYTGVGIEIEQDKKETVDEEKVFKIFSKKTYHVVFVKPWTMKRSAIVLTGLFIVLFGDTQRGWGATSPFGIWFGKILMFFGVPASKLAAFTHKPIALFTTPLWQQGSSVQDFGIIIGTIICLLLAGTFHGTFKSELKISFKEVIIFAIGGFLMGFGTRLSNGCNVGALYTPISGFSLSGWIFLVAMIIGAIYGNKASKKIN